MTLFRSQHFSSHLIRSSSASPISFTTDCNSLLILSASRILIPWSSTFFFNSSFSSKILFLSSIFIFSSFSFSSICFSAFPS
ncbi:hypothetical protein HanPSC8_Chr03g0099111 [Helianthus annuus]|nr:hypothetical protein HanPSC8_Chr03g0099111 [Helianthus annuus]